MALNLWSGRDPLPELPELRGLSVTASDNIAALAALCQLEPGEIERRLSTGNQPYIAYMGKTPVAYGWVAAQRVSIGELDLSGELPSDSRYLWDFKTLPDWRGAGIYPRLLQHILQRETASAEDFWIINAPENIASGRGITKAGFLPVGNLAFIKASQAAGLVSYDFSVDQSNRAHKGAALLTVPLLKGAAQTDVAPCWHCVIAKKSEKAAADPSCWQSVCECGTKNKQNGEVLSANALLS